VLEDSGTGVRYHFGRKWPEPKRDEVRIRVQAAGVSLPDIMMREGIHPETPRLPVTPGWDLVGVVDVLGNGAFGVEPGQIVAALPIHGAYAEFVCLPQCELVPVPPGLDAAEAVSLVLNYVTAYQSCIVRLRSNHSKAH
jgi:NADPH:quinone reductase-like Zn-dependent oxidoreductase